MRRFAWVGFGMLALLPLGGAADAAERAWLAMVGGGTAIPSDGAGLESGASMFVGVATPVLPWFLIGVEAGGRQFASAGGVSIPEVHVSQDRTRDVSLVATLRLQVPVSRGPAPFAVGEAGVGCTRWGDVHVYDLGFGFGQGNPVMPGRVEWGVRSAVGVGIRCVLSRPWPDFEVSAREALLSGDHSVKVFEPSFSLAW